MVDGPSLNSSPIPDTNPNTKMRTVLATVVSYDIVPGVPVTSEAKARIETFQASPQLPSQAPIDSSAIARSKPDFCEGKPVLLVDIDHVYVELGTDIDAVRSYLQDLREQGYQVTAMTLSNSDENLLWLQRELPSFTVLRNDFKYSNYDKHGKGYGLFVYEFIKALRYQSHTPIAGFVGYPIAFKEGFESSDIVTIAYGEDLSNYREPLEAAFQKFCEKLAEAKETGKLREFLWDGLTDSRMLPGNVELILDPEEALETYVGLLRAPELLYALVVTIGLMPDGFDRDGNALPGEQIIGSLEAAIKAGKDVKVLSSIIGRATPFAGPLGFSAIVDEVLERLGSSLVIRDGWPHGPDCSENKPNCGFKEFRHEKFRAFGFLGKLVILMGGRPDGAVAFGPYQRTEPVGFFEEAFDIGNGSLVDFTLSLQGQIAEEAFRKTALVLKEHWPDFDVEAYLAKIGQVSPVETNGETRYIYQRDHYTDNNVTAALRLIISNPDAEEVVLFNSFPISQHSKDLLEQAVKDGKKVTLVIGRLISNYDRLRDVEIRWLMEAGVNVVVIRERVHGKAYFNRNSEGEGECLTGSPNLDGDTYDDSENAMMSSLDHPMCKGLVAEIERYKAAGTSLNEYFRDPKTGKLRTDLSDEEVEVAIQELSDVRGVKPLTNPHSEKSPALRLPLNSDGSERWPISWLFHNISYYGLVPPKGAIQAWLNGWDFEERLELACVGALCAVTLDTRSAADSQVVVKRGSVIDLGGRTGASATLAQGNFENSERLEALAEVHMDLGYFFPFEFLAGALRLRAFLGLGAFVGTDRAWNVNFQVAPDITQTWFQGWLEARLLVQLQVQVGIDEASIDWNHRDENQRTQKPTGFEPVEHIGLSPDLALSLSLGTDNLRAMVAGTVDAHAVGWRAALEAMVPRTYPHEYLEGLNLGIGLSAQAECFSEGPDSSCDTSPHLDVRLSIPLGVPENRDR